MRKDFAKAALALLTVVVCTVTVANLRNGNIFGDNVMAKPAFTDNLSDSYNRLKQDLKDKYVEIIYKIVDKIKAEIIYETSVIFGETTMQKIEEAETLKSEIDKIKNDFYGEDRYKTLQGRLTALKNELSAATKSKAKEITSEMQVAMDKITTLNITLRNRIKDKNERLSELNSFIENEFDKNKAAFDKVREEVFGKVKDEIADCLDEYNDELALLNETFGKDTEEMEMPFDENEIKLDIPIFSIKSTASRADTYIQSDNDDPLKN